MEKCLQRDKTPYFELMLFSEPSSAPCWKHMLLQRKSMNEVPGVTKRHMTVL